MRSPSQHHDTVAALEHELLTRTCEPGRRRVESLLHRDFYEHGASGRTWTRKSILDELPVEPDVDGAAVDLASGDPAPDVVLLTYRILGTRPSTRSSLRVWDDDRWQMLFHQGTLTAPSPPG